ncbi:MAG TPA: hypothetical protein VI792_08010, partial [Candidatus Eisenbacteria bacterium]
MIRLGTPRTPRTRRQPPWRMSPFAAVVAALGALVTLAFALFVLRRALQGRGWRRPARKPAPPPGPEARERRGWRDVRAWA